ncbi:carbohydrate ABC transporter permease [Paenibacillus oryzisoli]|uniref:carbohydrate ABC transporter permease n=1 Tax=Paenibacillus oryzisoli TaxID=1850517 RepID=UPI003D2B4BA4
MRGFRGFFPHAILLVYVAVILCPLGWVLLSSFKTNKEIIAAPWAFPAKLSLANYWNAWSGAHVGRYLLNSVVNSAVSALGALGLGTATAFALTRMKFPRISRLLRRVFLLALLVPSGALIVPLYLLLRDLHLVNTPLALILPYLVLELPWTIYMVSAFMASIPSELEEAGIMDGLSVHGLLWRILVPISIPSLFTVFMLNFLTGWNEFMMANVFLTKEALRTLPVSMVAFYDQLNMNYGSLSAAIVLSMLPVVAMYFLMHRRIMVHIKA